MERNINLLYACTGRFFFKQGDNIFTVMSLKDIAECALEDTSGCEEEKAHISLRRRKGPHLFAKKKRPTFLCEEEKAHISLYTSHEIHRR